MAISRLFAMLARDRLMEIRRSVSGSTQLDREGKRLTAGKSANTGHDMWVNTFAFNSHIPQSRCRGTLRECQD